MPTASRGFLQKTPCFSVRCLVFTAYSSPQITLRESPLATLQLEVLFISVQFQKFYVTKQEIITVDEFSATLRRRLANLQSLWWMWFQHSSVDCFHCSCPLRQERRLGVPVTHSLSHQGGRGGLCTQEIYTEV